MTIASPLAISSVDTTRDRAVLKQPTEVTQLVEIPPAAVLRDEKGNAIRLQDLRAGDTIYAVVKRAKDGQLVISSLRRGPMTIDELRARDRRRMLEADVADGLQDRPAEADLVKALDRGRDGVGGEAAVEHQWIV